MTLVESSFQLKPEREFAWKVAECARRNNGALRSMLVIENTQFVVVQRRRYVLVCTVSTAKHGNSTADGLFYMLWSTSLVCQSSPEHGTARRINSVERAVGKMSWRDKNLSAVQGKLTTSQNKVLNLLQLTDQANRTQGHNQHHAGLHSECPTWLSTTHLPFAYSH